MSYATTCYEPQCNARRAGPATNYSEDWLHCVATSFLYEIWYQL
jgi:hypothetical protein